MKKGIMVITMFVALSFLVSVIAVAPSFAKQATQTTPTSKQAPQQGPAQAPQTRKPRFPKNMEKLHTVFWELEPLRCVINGVSKPCNCQGTTAAINVIVTPGQPLTITCYYQVKTPPINDITEADVKAWGWGRSYTLCYDFPGFDRIEEIRTLPKFTWADVKLWKKGGQGNAPKIRTEPMVLKLTMPEKLIGVFVVDFKDVIKELHEGLSNWCCISINQ